MQKRPLFSVLMANYNNGCYLQDAIDSILMQTYPNFEIILVDDNSTDDSQKIYDKYEDDPRFHIYHNDKNRGLGFTWRRCAELSNGDILGIVDPDDVLLGTDVFDVMVDKHLECPEASLVYSGMYRADERLNITEETPGKDVGGKLLESRGWPIHHFATFKRSMYEKTEGFDEIQRRAVDYDLYYKLEEVGDVVCIDCLQYIQRNTPSSLSLNENAYRASAWHIVAAAKAMKRRGLSDESLLMYPMETVERNSYAKGVKDTKSSLNYRVGRMILFPFIILGRLWKR